MSSISKKQIESILEVIPPDMEYDWLYKEGDHIILDIENIEKLSKVIKDLNKNLKITENDFFIISINNYSLGGFYRFAIEKEGLMYDFVVHETLIKKAPLNILLKYYESIEDYETCGKLLKEYE